MKLLEYEAKQLLEAAGAVVPRSAIIRADDVPMIPPILPIVVKAQVPVGGRGKAGGIVIAETEEAYRTAVSKVFATNIKGYRPSALLLEPKLPIEHEYYLALLINRETASIELLARQDGGIEIENTTGEFFRCSIDSTTVGEVALHVAKVFAEKDTELIENIVQRLYDCFVRNDATLLEINPLARTVDGLYVCVDAKIELDDAAAFRHEWDFEDKPHDTNYVTLDELGEVATIANGAGLAMATVDAVAARGMKPANFLDVGGGANKASVLQAFTRISQYRHVKAIVINIFAGITRCDEVARAIIAAQAEIDGLPPLFIRLAGTNFEAAVALLEQENIPTLATLEACLIAAKESIHGK